MRVLSQTHGYVSLPSLTPPLSHFVTPSLPQLNYLAMAPVLRFGVNQNYFPLSEGAAGECFGDEVG